jgi:tetratricopeptide (TPR) repeat protein
MPARSPSSRKARPWAWIVIAATLALLLTVRPAHAAGDDAAVQSAVTSVLQEEYATAAFGPAKKKLEAALDRCKRGKCTGATKAQIYVALGMVASQIGLAEEAKAQFVNALKEDKNAQLPASGTTPNIRNQWAEAQKTLPAAPAPEPPAAEPSEPEQGGSKPTKIPGWNSPEAFQAAAAALAAGKAGKFDECIAKDKESLALEEQPRTRLHLGLCEERVGKLIDSLRDTQKALEMGIKTKDQPLMKLARERVQTLLKKIPHVTFVPPPGVADLTVTFDGKPVPQERLGRQFAIDPGKHKVRAEGTANGVPLQFEEEYDVKEGDLLTVNITLKSQAPEYLTQGQMKCMLAAKSQEEVLKCLPEGKQNIVVRGGTDVSVYTDTLNVNVVSPAINVGVSSPTAGWNVAASYLLDVVTAASPDIVSMASRNMRDRRHAGTLSGGYKTGIFNFQGGAFLSVENDYISGGGNLSATADLREKTITPRIGVQYSHDVIGRTGAPYDVFSRQLDTWEFGLGVAMVLGPKTILTVSGTLQTERGDQSKPYRYIPIFSTTIARQVPVGATYDLVNKFRLPLKPMEQLPTERDRYAIGFRFAQRMGSSTLRLEERLYYDTWGIFSSTTDGRYLVDAGKRLRLWPHVRFNAQSAASFYQLAYSAILNDGSVPGRPAGSVTLPLYRSTDRELSPLITLTGGGGARFALTSPESKTQMGVTLQGDVMYTKFFSSLYVTSRIAVYGTLSFDVEFE